MNICRLQLVNDYGVVVEHVDFMAEPFSQPFNFRIPKATKRVRETGDNLFRDGSDITAVRYNNAVASLQPSFSFPGCTLSEAQEKIESLRSKIDLFLEEARRRSLIGYGARVQLLEDSKGFPLASSIIDGTFDIDDDWSGSRISQGYVINSNLSLTREPFRVDPYDYTLSNMIVNPGFDKGIGSVVFGWYATGSATLSTTGNCVKGTYGALLSVVSGATDAVMESSNTVGDQSLGDGVLFTIQRYYLEAWAYVPPGADDLTLQIINYSTLAVDATITWSASDVPYNAADISVYRSNSQNRYSPSGTSAKFLMRKAVIFTPSSQQSYFIRFKVTTPNLTTDYYIDRVALTIASYLHWTPLSDQSLTPVGSANYKGKFAKSWMGCSLLTNHADDGATYHGTGSDGLLLSMQAHWKLDETSGNALDAHSTNTLTDNATVTSNPGKIGTARQFTAANGEFFNRADNAALSVGDIDFSSNSWVLLDSKGADRTILSKGTSDATANFEYRLLYANASDRFVWIVSNGTTDTSVLANALGSPATATWYNIYVYHDSVNNLIGIRVNDTYENTAAHTVGSQDTAGDFRIGASAAAAFFHDGRVDEVSFRKRLLKSHEITQIYNKGNGLGHPFNAYHANYLDVVDVPGDVPPISRFALKTIEYSGLFVALRTIGAPTNSSQYPTSEFSGSIDSDASQNNKTVSAALSTSYATAGTATKTASSDQAGRYRILLRLKDTASVQGNLRVKTTVTIDAISFDNTEFTPPSAGSSNWSVSDAGIAIIPPQFTDPSFFINHTSLSVVVKAKRTTGTETVEIDFLQLFPVDEWFAFIAVPANTSYVVFQNLPEFLNAFASDGTISEVKFVVAHNAQPLVCIPARQNRYYFIQSAGAHDLDHKMVARLSLQPKYL